MTSDSLTLVLPAFNEAERIGPALDELFGYLRRRGAEARDGAPGSGELPDRIDVLVVDDGSTDGTADLVRARPGGGADAAVARAPAPDRCPTAGRAPPSGPGCSHARSDLVVFADADMATPPDMLPLLVGGPRRPRCRPRQPDPAGRLRHAEEPAVVSADARQGVPPPRVGLGGRTGEGHPVRVQGVHAAPPRRTSSRVSGSRASSSTSSSSTSPGGAATGSPSCRSAGRTGAVRGCAPGRRSPCGSPGTCSGSRSSTVAPAPRAVARPTDPGMTDLARPRSRLSLDSVSPEAIVSRLDRPAQIGLGLMVLAALVYWLSNRLFDATRGDFFYLADAFLHGRVWLDVRLGFQDVIVRRRPHLRPVRAVPGDRAHADRRRLRAGHRRPVGDRDQRGPGGVDGRARVVVRRPGRRPLASSTGSSSSSSSGSRPRSGGSRPAAASGTPAS